MEAQLNSTSPNARGFRSWWFLIYAILLLPYVLVYLLNLCSLSHYQFFPLVLLAVGYAIWDRSKQIGIAGPDWRSKFLLVISLMVALIAALFASPWLGYAAFLVAAAAVLLRILDLSTNKSLVVLLLPLLLIWQPPYSTGQTGDTILISKLQQVSSVLSSMWLDVAGFVHFRTGTVLEFPGKNFGVAEACSGVQSFFALLCFASLIIVFQNRGWIHSSLLLLSSVAWAIAMNTVRITAIPVAHELAQFDLAEGLPHEILGYTTMGVALFLLLSTDNALMYFFGDSESKANALPRSALLADHEPKLGMWQVVSLLPFLLVFGLQAQDVLSSWGQQKERVDFFRSNVLLEVSESDAPKSINAWTQASYHSENRERGADLGERSSIWTYRNGDDVAILSFDQAFPGWHELTVCYTLTGWQLADRQVNVADGKWKVVTADLRKPNGESGFLIFGLFDSSGQPNEPPGKWDAWSSLRERIQNRLSPTVRGSLFSLAAYQVQWFVPSRSPLSDAKKSEALSAFLSARESLRKNVLE